MMKSKRKKTTTNDIHQLTSKGFFENSKLFADLSPSQRRECFRMMEGAIKCLWTRLGYVQDRSQRSQGIDDLLRTLNRHSRLQEAVRHLFEENQERNISALRLSPGTCAACMYLMATSGMADEAVAAWRRNGTAAEPPGEYGLDLSMWGKAEKFFVLLGYGTDFEPVRQAISELTDMDSGENGIGPVYINAGGPVIERLAVLARAWRLFAANEEITLDRIRIQPITNRRRSKNGKPLTANPTTFGGIDLGESELNSIH